MYTRDNNNVIGGMIEHTAMEVFHYIMINGHDYS